MRIKMKTLMSFLAMLVGIFMIGDIFLFSSVGKHSNRASRTSVQDSHSEKSPYNLDQDVKFLKRQIKSGREYLSEGIKSFTGQAHEDGELEGDEDYTGLRDNVLGALDVPGMRQKLLPVAKAKQQNGELSDIQELERELMDGTLHEEQPPKEETEELLHEEQDYETPLEEHDDPSEGSDKNANFQWSSLFGFGHNTEGENKKEEDSVVPDTDKIGMDSFNVPGMDDRILNKLNFQANEDDLFQKKEEVREDQPPEDVKPTEEELEDAWLYAQLKDARGNAESSHWAEADRKAQQLLQEQTPQEQPQTQSKSAYGFLASLFQPFKFSGSTGDDQDDGGWASVGELDTLADSVQRAIVPGMQQKFLAVDSAGFQVNAIAPGEENAMGAVAPGVSNQQSNSEFSNELNVPSIPGLSDNFFDKFIKNSDGTLSLPQDSSYNGPIQVPNVPGLADGFFQKYGDNILPEEVQPADQQPQEEPQEVQSLSMDFFNKFIHPVAQGQAALPRSDNMLVESLEEVPGLPDDFFEKYVKQQKGDSDATASKEELEQQGFNLDAIPGLSNYLEQYSKDDGQPVIPLEALKQSLQQAQGQVPGMPSKVLPLDGEGMAEFVPPSGLPQLSSDGTSSVKQGMFSLLLKAFSRQGAPGGGNAMPYMPSDPTILPNGTVVVAPPTVTGDESQPAPYLKPTEAGQILTPDEGFQLKTPEHPSGLSMDELIQALVPNVTDTGNDTMKLDDARGFLSQLEGVMHPDLKAVRPNLAEELANITALEDSRVVHCNLTKSPLWKVAITDRWHTVKDGLMFVYSSYLDDRIRGHTAIRILGILEGWEVGMHLKPFCQIWFQDKSAPYVIGATYEWLPGQPIAKFKAVLLTCVYQTSHVEGKPLAVSLTTEPCEEPQFLVKIHTRNETVSVKKTNFTICLTGPMKFGYADVGQFIQWMEFNIMMGVERFVLYNHSMDAALRPYLVHYAKLGYVQLFPWVIPENIPNPLVFLKNLGHLAMINDCLYRNMWTSKHVVFMDIDEMVLPRYGHVTFGPMLKNAGCDTKPQAVVQSVFFRREWPNDELFANNQTIVNMGLVGLLKTKRERKIWPPYMRSKYFIKPDEVLITNVHAAHSFLSPLDYQDLSCIFNPKEVVLHHYRYWGEVTGNYVVDRRLHEYGDDLINRAAKVYESVLGQKVT